MICILSSEGTAQNEGRDSKKDSLPRVGTIKDYPATGLMTGCGNLYFYPSSRASSSDETYVFLARGDGRDAWMNLDGRDVRLRQIRSSTGNTQRPGRYNYRLGTLHITVVIEDYQSKNVPVEEGDSMFKMKITLQRGRAVRIVRAIGDADC